MISMQNEMIKNLLYVGKYFAQKGNDPQFKLNLLID